MRYLRADVLAASVDRLQRSAAKSRLVDYLILRRALVLGAPPDADRATVLAGQVQLSMKDGPFMRAMYEMAAAAQADDEGVAEAKLYDLEALGVDGAVSWAGQPYFQPLGTAGETEHGYRTKKYRSNGTADTVAKSIFVAKQIVELVPNVKPRAIRLGPGNTPDVLSEAFLGTGNKPRIDDMAIWWFRATDIEPRFGADATIADLVSGFMTDLALDDDEATALFDLAAEGGTEASDAEGSGAETGEPEVPSQ